MIIMSEDKKKKHGGAGLGLLFGAIGGAIAGLLFAPKSGKELREDIKRLYNDVESDIWDEAKKATNLTKTKFEDIVAQVVEKYGPMLEKSKSLDEWKDDLKKEWPKIKKKITGDDEKSKK